MLIKKFLTEDIVAALDGAEAQCGFTLQDIIRSGMANPDSNIGAYAGDADCYSKFSLLFDPIIEAYHGFNSTNVHTDNFAKLSPDQTSSFQYSSQQILSTRIRVARNIEDFSFPPSISSSDQLALEQKIVGVLEGLGGDLAGSYFSLKDMTEETQERLTKLHFLFKKGDRFLEAAGVNRFWPFGRGIFFTNDKKFLAWVNEEDHLRIISMQQGGDLAAVYERLRQAVEKIGKQLKFAHSKRLGHLSSCPSNLGTAMRASVHITLPLLSQQEDFFTLCDKMQLSVRGVHGEHSDSENGVWDISNKQRLGVTELECLEKLHNGITTLLQREKNLQ